VALFRWKAGTTEEQKRQIQGGLAELPSLIPEVRDYRFGPDAGLVDSSWDFAVVAQFDDADGWRSYREHPAHQRILAEHIGPAAAERASVQFEVRRKFLLKLEPRSVDERL
jgi:hypothetical protein